MTGTIRHYYPNSTILFTLTDSLVRTDEGIVTISSPINYTYENTYIDQYSTYIINIEQPNNLMFEKQIPFAKKGDTLILAEPHINSEKYFITKIK